MKLNEKFWKSSPCKISDKDNLFKNTLNIIQYNISMRNIENCLRYDEYKISRFSIKGSFSVGSTIFLNELCIQRAQKLNIKIFTYFVSFERYILTSETMMREQNEL